MGNDGGSIPTRRELVKEAARDPNLSAVKEKQREHLAHRWTQCPISHRALRSPIVSDYSGDLYNKDAIIQYLLPTDVSPLDKSAAEKFIQGRVRSLKDVVEVKFEVEEDVETKLERCICPVTSKELGPNTRAVFIVPCGHAFSKEAIDVMKDINSCPSCGTNFDPRDIVPIFPTSETAKRSTVERMEILTGLGLTHSLKKAQSGKKRKTTEDPAQITMVGGSYSRKPKTEHDVRKSVTVMASETKVPGEQISNKKARLSSQDSDNLRSLYSKGDVRGDDGGFMTRGFSIKSNANKK